MSEPDPVWARVPRDSALVFRLEPAGLGTLRDFLKNSSWVAGFPDVIEVLKPLVNNLNGSRAVIVLRTTGSKTLDRLSYGVPSSDSHPDGAVHVRVISSKEWAKRFEQSLRQTFGRPIATRFGNFEAISVIDAFIPLDGIQPTEPRVDAWSDAIPFGPLPYEAASDELHSDGTALAAYVNAGRLAMLGGSFSLLTFVDAVREAPTDVALQMHYAAQSLVSTLLATFDGSAVFGPGYTLSVNTTSIEPSWHLTFSTLAGANTSTKPVLLPNFKEGHWMAMDVPSSAFAAVADARVPRGLANFQTIEELMRFFFEAGSFAYPLLPAQATGVLNKLLQLYGVSPESLPTAIRLRVYGSKHMAVCQRPIVGALGLENPGDVANIKTSLEQLLTRLGCDLSGLAVETHSDGNTITMAFALNSELEPWVRKSTSSVQFRIESVPMGSFLGYADSGAVLSAESGAGFARVTLGAVSEPTLKRTAAGAIAMSNTAERCRIDLALAGNRIMETFAFASPAERQELLSQAVAAWNDRADCLDPRAPVSSPWPDDLFGHATSEP